MRILITGSEGFTGQYVCREFSNAGWEVWRAGVSEKSGVNRYLSIDLLKPDSLTCLTKVAKLDVVLHLAGVAFVQENNPYIFYHVNLLGTRHLLDALSRAKQPPASIIIASSANVYGNTGLEIIDEDATKYPANDYAVSKLSMEYLAKTFNDKLDLVITRPFNYTGRGQSESFLIAKIVSHFRNKKSFIELGNLNIKRDFSDVRDIARFYRLLAEQRRTNLTVNLCSGVSVSLKTILSATQALSGHKIEIRVNPEFKRKNEVLKLTGDRSKLESLIEIGSTYSLNDTLSWMLKP